MGKLLKIQTVYNEIIEYYGWNKNCPDEVDIESKYKLLRNKYKALMTKIIFRDISLYKQHGNNMIPAVDAPIIRNLLIHSISDNDEDVDIVKWFNGKIDLSKPENSIRLFDKVKVIIKEPYENHETNIVTTTEWLDTISASINYNTAHNTLRIINEIEKFRQTSLALNDNIGAGQIIYSYGDGTAFFHSKPEKSHIYVRNHTLDEVLSKAYSQDDYLYILMQVIRLLEEDAQKKAIERIKIFAKQKKTFYMNKADEFYYDKGDEPSKIESLASEYVIYFQRIHEFLESNPDITQSIENELSVDNLNDFFEMKER